MKKNKQILLIAFITVIVIGCSKETINPEPKYIAESLTHGENLRTASFDSTNNNFILGYWNYDNQVKYEVRDENFEIIKSGIYEGPFYTSPPGTITMINDSVFVGSNNRSNFSKTKENLLITKYTDINLFSEIVITDPTIGRTPIFTSDFSDILFTIFDTEEYIVISAKKATCYFIKKSNFEVISFKDYFDENNNNSGGKAVGIDQLGNIILATTDGIKVYKNNEWLPFLNGEFDLSYIDYIQFYTDSKNRLYARTGDETIVYDLNTGEKILTITNGAFGRILGEHPDGSLLFFNSSTVPDDTKRIFKVKINN